MRTKLAIVIAGVIALSNATAVIAHHAFSAEFDEKKPVKLSGTVTRVEWVNPHAWIHVEVKNPDGTVTEWAIEGGTPKSSSKATRRKPADPGRTAAISRSRMGASCSWDHRARAPRERAALQRTGEADANRKSVTFGRGHRPVSGGDMQRSSTVGFGTACAILLLSSIASAQQASGIAGVVRASSGAVLPGVTVEAASPVLIERFRTVATDGEG